MLPVTSDIALPTVQPPHHNYGGFDLASHWPQPMAVRVGLEDKAIERQLIFYLP